MTNQEVVKIVFTDIRDTLGFVDKPGHLVPYKPSTEQFLTDMKDLLGLKIGVISNLPKNVSSGQGRRMLDEAGIAPFLDHQGIIFNHEAGYDKPNPEIYKFAARKVGLPVEQCLFVGENMPEVIGAQAAGMKATLKPYPPGRELSPKSMAGKPPTESNSGRWFERILQEDEHTLDSRIFACAVDIVRRLDDKALRICAVEDKTLLRAMSTLVYLIKHFVHSFHYAKEEDVLIPLALARGMPAEVSSFVAIEHDQGCAYLRGMEVALERIHAGDEVAAADFASCAGGYAQLYKTHVLKEDDELFPAIGKYITDADDALIVDLVAQIGPSDLTPYLALIQAMEGELGIQPS